MYLKLATRKREKAKVEAVAGAMGTKNLRCEFDGAATAPVGFSRALGLLLLPCFFQSFEFDATATVRMGSSRTSRLLLLLWILQKL